jgi:DNA-binding response OmpR family regulator
MAKLLIVDDETHIRMLYKKEFESDGYDVLTAAGAAEAMDILAKEHPNLVILDIELGDDNGLTMLNRLRQEYRDCAVILNSAYATYKSDFQSWLADAYIMKSSDLKPLKEKVKSLLTEGVCSARHK